MGEAVSEAESRGPLTEPLSYSTLLCKNGVAMLHQLRDNGELGPYEDSGGKDGGMIHYPRLDFHRAW